MVEIACLLFTTFLCVGMPSLLFSENTPKKKKQQREHLQKSFLLLLKETQRKKKYKQNWATESRDLEHVQDRIYRKTAREPGAGRGPKYGRSQVLLHSQAYAAKTKK